MTMLLPPPKANQRIMPGIFLQYRILAVVWVLVSMAAVSPSTRERSRTRRHEKAIPRREIGPFTAQPWPVDYLANLSSASYDQDGQYKIERPERRLGHFNYYPAQSRIVGGHPVGVDVPWYGHSRGRLLCGTTLIHADLMLTAAHCQGAFLAAGVSLGGHVLYQGTYVAVIQEVAHPDFDALSFDNDIMLVQLASPVRQGTPMVVLNNNQSIPINGAMATVIGYGTTSEKGPISNDLLTVDLLARNSSYCLDEYSLFSPAHMLCLGGAPAGGKDSCGGDSGGPALLNGGNLQVGIVSSGFGCGRPYMPGVYTRVSAYTDWIRTQICSLSRVRPITCPPVFPQIMNSSFAIQAVVRFNTLVGTQWQRVFDFSNGPAQDNILLGQCRNSLDMCFQVWIGGNNQQLRVANVLKTGVEQIWNVGQTSQGILWMNLNGTRAISSRATWPSAVIRHLQLLGQSPWSTDTPLQGAVLGLAVTVGEAVGRPSTPNWLNVPGPIRGAFAIRAYARFDNLTRTHQRIFEFSNGPFQDEISLGQCKNTAHMCFSIWEKPGQSVQVKAVNSIQEGVLSYWSCGVDRQGVMWLAKDGVRLTETPRRLPAAVVRQFQRIGQSNRPGSDPLDGIVLALKVVNYS